MNKLCVLLAALPLFGAPIGNPTSPALLQEGLFIPDTVWCQPRASFAEDFLTSQQLCGSRHLIGVNNIQIHGYSSLGALTWSIAERFDLSVILGSCEQKMDLSIAQRDYKARYSGGLVWYGEAKLVLVEMKDTSICAYGEAGGWSWMNGTFADSQEILSRSAQLLMRFWSVGATLSQKFRFLCPYAGVIVMRSRWKMDQTGIGGLYLHQRFPVGPVIGLSLSNASKILLNAEWRGWVENAFTVSSEVRF
jgi:hypothetical protein